jgi:hypothetical protein
LFVDKDDENIAHVGQGVVPRSSSAIVQSSQKHGNALVEIDSLVGSYDQ